MPVAIYADQCQDPCKNAKTVYLRDYQRPKGKIERRRGERKEYMNSKDVRVAQETFEDTGGNPSVREVDSWVLLE